MVTPFWAKEVMFVKSAKTQFLRRFHEKTGGNIFGENMLEEGPKEMITTLGVFKFHPDFSSLFWFLQEGGPKKKREKMMCCCCVLSFLSFGVVACGGW